MTKYFSLSIIILCLIKGSAGANVWTQLADFPGAPRSSAVSFVLGDSAYIGTGYDSTSFKRSFYKYDREHNWWSQVNPLGGSNGSGLSRNMAVSFSIGNKGYVATGQGGNPYLYDVWEYDPTTDAWTQKANFEGTARRGAVAFSIGNTAYLGTGEDGTGYKNDFWSFNSDSNNWNNVASFPGDGRRLAVAFTLGSKGYVGTGEGASYYNDFWAYDPASDSWTQKADFAGTKRTGAVGFAYAGKGYIGMGYDTTLNNKKDLWAYDPTGNSWSLFSAPFPGDARANAVGFSIGSYMFIGTGFGDAPLRDFWQYGYPLGVEETKSLQNNAKIFPNPLTSNSRITIDAEMKNNEGEFRLFDNNGRTVRVISHLSGNEFSISKDELIGGNYFFEIFSGKNLLATGKLMVL